MDQAAHHIGIIEKSVIIHKDENGFGLRVLGQEPVFVDFVHENGAAWKAGVRKGDNIIKVNGTLVKSFDHQRVVHMIQSCTFVNLTLHSENTVDPPNHILPTMSTTSIDVNDISLGNNSSSNNCSTTSNILPHHQIQLAHQIEPWLQEIGHDIYQDNTLSQYQPISSNYNNQPQSTSSSNQTGVQKLVENIPNHFLPKHQTLNSGFKLRSRFPRNQFNQGDNHPHYYYKPSPDKAFESLAGNQTLESSSQASKPGHSITRSRSSGSKFSIRPSSNKSKANTLKTRLELLTISNNQVNSSSLLSSESSSSDSSDCDVRNSNCRLEYCHSNSTSGHLVNSKNNCSSSQLLTVPLTSQEKQTTRRLEVIKELIDTEKTHTERLKQLNELLYKPIKKEGLVPVDQLGMVFSCHKELLKIHRKIYRLLSIAQENKSRFTNEPLIGQTLVEIFEGDLGLRLEKAACIFCACQATNVDALNRFTRKDTKVGEFLAQVANQQMLGRLGVKDLLASCFQRLTKYPLLLDNLIKAIPSEKVGIHTKSMSEGSIVTNLTKANSLILSNPTAQTGNEDHSEPKKEDSSINGDEKNNSNMTLENDNNNSTTKFGSEVSEISMEFDDERLYVTRALYQTRKILTHVNEAVKKAMSHNKLKEIWKQIEKHPEVNSIDISTQQLLHEGALTLRLARRTFDVYVLLLTHYIVILTREGQDKYKLKQFTLECKTPAHFSPIFCIDEHLTTRDTATDENGFYLLYKKKDLSRIFEFSSQSPAERNKWKEKIYLAQMFLGSPTS